MLYNLITYFYVYSVQLFIEKFITHKILPCSRRSTKKQLSPYFLGITIDKICRKGYNIEEDINENVKEDIQEDVKQDIQEDVKQDDKKEKRKVAKI